MTSARRASTGGSPPLTPPIEYSGRLDPAFAGRVLEDPGLRPLAPSVYLQAKRDGTALRDGALRDLWCLYAANRLHSTIRHEELGRRLEAFAAEAIPAIPLKGTFLATRLYGDVGARSLGYDIDLLVRREDAAAATALLERDGYRPTGPPDRYDRPFERREADSSTTTVELHVELLPRWFRAAGLSSAMWSRARPPVEAGFPAWTLDPGDELLHLGLHLVKDQLETRPTPLHLRHGLDIHLALERWAAEIDWSAFLERAREQRLHAYAALAFGFVAHWFGSRVPEALAAELPRWKRACFERSVWKLEAGGGDRLAMPMEARLLGLILLLDDGWPARFGHLGWAGSELGRRWSTRPMNR